MKVENRIMRGLKKSEGRACDTFPLSQDCIKSLNLTYVYNCYIYPFGKVCSTTISIMHNYDHITNHMKFSISLVILLLFFFFESNTNINVIKTKKDEIVNKLATSKFIAKIRHK